MSYPLFTIYDRRLVLRSDKLTSINCKRTGQDLGVMQRNFNMKRVRKVVAETLIGEIR